MVQITNFIAKLTINNIKFTRTRGIVNGRLVKIMIKFSLEYRVTSYFVFPGPSCSINLKHSGGKHCLYD